MGQRKKIWKKIYGRTEKICGRTEKICGKTVFPIASPVNLIVMFREGMAGPINVTMVVLLSCPILFS
jgi:hypothetical protein